jgi:hypothetical protein
MVVPMVMAEPEEAARGSRTDRYPGAAVLGLGLTRNQRPRQYQQAGQDQAGDPSVVLLPHLRLLTR